MTTDTARSLTVLLPLPPRVLSPNGPRGMHWARRGKAVRDYRQDCGMLARSAWVQADLYGTPPMGRAAVVIRWIYCRTAHTGAYCATDIDNALAAGGKPALDSLIDAGIITGDRASQLSIGQLSIERHRGHAVGQCQSGVEITISEVQP